MNIRSTGWKSVRIALVLWGVIVAFLPSSLVPAQAAKENITFGYASISPSMAGVWMAKEMGAFEKRSGFLRPG